MKQRIASAPPRTWNQKNLPSNLDRFGESEGGTEQLLEQLPQVAKGFARRHRRALVLSLAALGALSIWWIVSNQD